MNHFSQNSQANVIQIEQHLIRNRRRHNDANARYRESLNSQENIIQRNQRLSIQRENRQQQRQQRRILQNQINIQPNIDVQFMEVDEINENGIIEEQNNNIADMIIPDIINEINEVGVIEQNNNIADMIIPDIINEINEVGEIQEIEELNEITDNLREGEAATEYA